jgi:prepilin-type N-terminal cleavage/methylation domain-containing protein
MKGRIAQRWERGFSLIEVMVAILILGVALVGLTEAVTLGLQSNKDSEYQTTAAMYAAGLIETLRAEGDFEDGETEGDCGSELPLYRWKQTVTKTDLDGLYQVQVVVANARSGKAIYELATLLFESPTAPEVPSGTGRDHSRRQRVGGAP